MQFLVVKVKQSVKKMLSNQDTIGMQLIQMVIVYYIWKIIITPIKERFQIIFPTISTFLVIEIKRILISHKLLHNELAVALKR